MELNCSKETTTPESSPSASPVLARQFKSQGMLTPAPVDAPVRQEIPKDILSSVNRFQKKQKKSTIDVWWMYDDGGLTMLIPYIISLRREWSRTRLRVFALANRKDQLDREQRNMAALLTKFRIDYSDVIIVPGVVKAPLQSTRQKFSDLISKFRSNDKLPDSDQQGDGLTGGRESRFSDRITEAEIIALKDKVRTCF